MMEVSRLPRWYMLGEAMITRTPIIPGIIHLRFSSRSHAGLVEPFSRTGAFSRTVALFMAAVSTVVDSMEAPLHMRVSIAGFQGADSTAGLAEADSTVDLQVAVSILAVMVDSTAVLWVADSMAAV